MFSHLCLIGSKPCLRGLHVNGGSDDDDDNDDDDDDIE